MLVASNEGFPSSTTPACVFTMFPSQSFIRQRHCKTRVAQASQQRKSRRCKPLTGGFGIRWYPCHVLETHNTRFSATLSTNRKTARKIHGKRLERNTPHQVLVEDA